MTFRLIPPVIQNKYIIDGLRIAHPVALTVYGSDSGLVAAECPSSDLLATQQYVFYGGHEYTTNSTALRDLWLAAGGTVENV